jgi:DNA-binding NtrC family response regulator
VLSQNWPGNIRELKSAVQRAVLLSQGDEIEARDFRMGSSRAASTVSGTLGPAWLGAPDLEAAKTAFIRTKVDQALEMTEGNRTRAAVLLGITPRTLFRYLEQKGSVTELS